LIVTADHGEALGENGIFFFHGLTVSLDQIHVPLIVKPPASFHLRPQRLAGPVSTIDILPTVLTMLGLDHESRDVKGISLWPAIRGAGRIAPDRCVFSENEAQLSVIQGSFQFLYGRGVRRTQQLPYFYPPALEGTRLVDYVEDSLGQHDASLTHPAVLEMLKDAANRFLSASPSEPGTAAQPGLSDQESRLIDERLKKLGYS
jgi:arylsulfatase A-like enzyme